MRTQRFSGLAVVLSLIFIAGCAEQKDPPPRASITGQPDLSSSTEAGSPFKCELKVLVGDGKFTFSIFFSSHYAVEFDPEDQEQVAAVYDLDALSWQDFSPPRTVRLQDCEAWARSTAETTRSSIDSVADPKLKRFVEQQLRPQFEVLEGHDTITFRNDVMTYRVSNPMTLDAIQRKRFFSYDRLNAYRKAMAQGKLAPFPQLAVDDGLESRGFSPGTIDLTIQTPNEEVYITVKARVSPLNSDEAEHVAKAIARANP